ncbi:CbtA family protein [Mesorhizobium sp. ZMM04-5]|uniref:CbtA family protein n=1 Tax=Mesorhizobium marinum TaxID=3228790 RepID=A0ABV3QWA5_9HYPH
MTVFRNAVFAAAAAGLLAGLILAALQTYATVPLILQAETFESAGAPAHDHGAAEAALAESGHHGGDAWAPEDGFERFAYTAGINIVSGIGFALLLVAVSEFAGGIANWRQGMIWGFAGFAVFTLAPGLGLPPELPAMPAADLFARQAWWIGTVAATAAGLALIAFSGRAPLAILGVALIVLPHVIGAPQPETHDSPVPDSLHHQFIVAATVTNLIFWVALGGIVGLVRQRFLGPPDNLGKSFA